MIFKERRRTPIRKLLKPVVAALCLIAIVISSIITTVAWIQVKTDTVVNTFFTVGIMLELNESVYDPDTNQLDKTVSRVKANDDYPLIPGWTLPKDPIVTVKGGSEACLLFVTLSDETPEDFLSYEVADGWTQGGTEADGNNVPSNVWYRTVAADEKDQPFEILADNQVKVNPELDLADMNALGGKSPRIIFHAYAIQSSNGDGGTFTPNDAWTQVSSLNK